MLHSPTDAASHFLYKLTPFNQWKLSYLLFLDENNSKHLPRPAHLRPRLLTHLFEFLKRRFSRTIVSFAKRRNFERSVLKLKFDICSIFFPYYFRLIRVINQRNSFKIHDQLSDAFERYTCKLSFS